MKQIFIKTIILIAVFFLGLSFSTLSTNKSPLTTNNVISEDSQPLPNASIMIDFGNNPLKIQHDIPISEGDSIYDTLVTMSTVQNFTLQATDYGEMGVFVEGIDTVTGSSLTWWQVWINNEYATAGASSIATKPNDVILWKLTNEQ